MKQGEIDYLKNLGQSGTASAYNKPFAEPTCAKNLVDMGLIMSLLPNPPSRVLDLGCGTGWTSWIMACRGHEVVGQDIANDMIDLANQNKERHGASRASFILSDYESLQFKEEFDAALFYDSLHHAEDEAAAIDCAFRALKPDGMLLTHEPGRGHSTSEAAMNAMRLYGVTEKDMPPSRIFELGRKAGFSSFTRMLDPTSLFMATYQVNIESGTRQQGLMRRLRSVAGLIRRMGDKDRGALCVLRK
jgi:SAM-dependent methyltransferase